jgi:hypothetical protein
MSQKQTGKGKGATHKSKHVQRKGNNVERELILANSSYGEKYAVVKEELGGCQFIVEDSDGRRVRATVSRGWSKGPNKDIVKKEHTVVISPGIGKDTFHICHRYDPDEVATLHARNLIKKPKSNNEIDSDSVITFNKEQDGGGTEDNLVAQEDYSLEEL